MGLTIPSLVVIFISILLLGSHSFIGVLTISIILFPELFQILYPAYTKLSSELREMAFIYRLSKFAYFKHIFLPQIIHFQLSATRIGISIGWKLAILTEVFTISNKGIGYKIYYYYNLFSIKLVFAWLLSFVIIMFFLEYGVLQILEEHLYPYLKKNDKDKNITNI